jgi:paraquat-inducible protein A
MILRNRLAVALAVVSLALLWPGLTQPALTIRATIELFGVSKEIANETRSVVGAVQSLRASGNLFVAGLIVLFSIVVPMLKAGMMIPIVLSPASTQSHRLYRLVQSISKWSMADVFAVGMLIALLAAKGTANLSAIAGPGLYFFAAYCLVSNASFQALTIEVPRRAP